MIASPRTEKQQAWWQRIHPLWWVVALTALGAFLRLNRLGTHGLWRDEAEAVFTAMATFPGGILEVLAGDVHAPLYFLLQHFWIGLFGRSEWAARGLSAVAGITAIPLIYLAGKRLFDRPTGALAAAVATLLPLHVICSRTARMYSLLPLLTLLNLLSLHTALTKRSRWSWIAYALTGAATLYTHYWGALWMVAMGLVALWELAWQRRPRAEWLIWVLAELAIALCFAPWLPTLFGQLRIQESVMGPWLPQQSTIANILRLFNELTALAWPRNYPFLWMGLLTLGAVRFALKLEEPGPVPTLAIRYPLTLAQNLAVGGLLIPMLLGALLVARAQGLTPSYVTMAVFPALCLVMARALRSLRYPALIALVGVGMAALWLRADLAMPRAPISTLREVAQYVQTHAAADDILLIAPDYIAPTVSYYFDGPQPQAAFPGLLRRVETMDWINWAARRQRAEQAIPEMLAYVAAHKTASNRIWMIVPLDAYPNDPFFERIRELKGTLDDVYGPAQTIAGFPRAVETAELYVWE